MSSRCYLDASALVKRYVVEPGSTIVNYLFQRVPSSHMMCLGLGTLEVISILVRKKNANQISPHSFQQALTDFRTQVVWSAGFPKVPITDFLLDSSTTQIVKHSINATDAVLLQSALDVAAPLRASGSDLILVASDLRLLRAASAEGLLTFDPERQTQTDLDTLLGP